MRHFVFVLFIFLLSSCAPKEKIENLEYQNIIIFSDMSDRLELLPNHDISKIKSLIDYFKNDCVAPGKKSGDRSAIYFSALSEQDYYCIDIDSIKDSGEKQMFVNSTSKYINSGLNSKIAQMKTNINNVYSIRNPGIDLISVLNEKLENSSFIKLDKTYKVGGKIDSIKFINHVYVFTDGYLEYQDYKMNNQFYFGLKQIKDLRKYCKRYNVDVLSALKRSSNLGLPPLKGSNNKYVNLHILETHERDRDFVKNKYDNISGLRDNEILESVWRKWATESGFRSFEWKKY